MAENVFVEQQSRGREKCPAWAIILLIAFGLLCILAATLVTPSFVLAHFSTPKGQVDPSSLPVLDSFRVVAAFLGGLALICAVAIPRNYLIFRRAVAATQLPCGTILLLLIGWGAIIAINVVLRGAGVESGIVYFFPINLLTPGVHIVGLPYAVCFLFLLFLFAVYKPPKNALQTWLYGLVLIVFGNLIQGGFDTAFYKPFLFGHDEYYDDAIKITNWQDWLAQFNQNQSDLLTHTKVHPPFTVLIQYAVLNLPGGLTLLSLGLVFVASLTVLLLYRILRSFGKDPVTCAKFGLLYCVLPGVNIYYAVSIDGLIATCATMALLGLILIIRERNVLLGIPTFLFGFAVVNALTFGVLFLWGVSIILAIAEVVRSRRYGACLALSIAIVLAISGQVILKHFLHYDHVQAFMTGSHIENPKIFRAFAEPMRYIGSRLTDISEIAVFLSLGMLAVLMRRVKTLSLGHNPTIGSDFYGIIAFLVLFAMFLTGAYRTGETARSCLFLYPYAVLLLIHESPAIVRSLTIFAGLQTAVMQFFGDYHW